MRKETEIDPIDAELQAMMEVRLELAAAKKAAESDLRYLDDQIKLLMITHDRKVYIGESGEHRMKITEGKNETILKKKVIEELSGFDWDPDMINGFLRKVTKVTSYDYIDCRAVAAKEEDDDA